MTTTNSMYKDFIQAQKQFKPVIFNRTNPFHKSQYADLGSHLDSVISALNDNNFSLIQKTHECESGVCVETIIYHESGEQISGGKFKVPSTKNDPQGYGAALTYARRFSLGSFLSLYGEEDNDGNEHIPQQNHDKSPVNKPPLQQKLDNAKQAQEARHSKEYLFVTGEAIASKGLGALSKWWSTDLNDEERKLIADKKDILKSKCPDFIVVQKDTQ